MDDLDQVKTLARDRQQHLDGPKFNRLHPWMTATYALDAQRKQNYLYMADRMRDWWTQKDGVTGTVPDCFPATPRDLLNEILNHNKFISDAARGARKYSSADWEIRAGMIELIIRHQVQCIYPDTQRVLDGFLRDGVDDPGEELVGRDLEPLPDSVNYVLPDLPESS